MLTGVWPTDHTLRNITRVTLAVTTLPKKCLKQNVQIAYCAQKCTFTHVCICVCVSLYTHTHTQRVHRNLILSNATSWFTFQHKLVVKWIPRKLLKLSCCTWIWAGSQLKFPSLFLMSCSWVIDFKKKNKNKNHLKHRPVYVCLLFPHRDSVWLAGLGPWSWPRVPNSQQLNSWGHPRT